MQIGTWEEGDTAKYWQSELTEPITAGLFFYSGFGQGVYYSADGKRYDLSGSEAQEMAAKEGVKYRWIDSFGHRPPGVYLGD
jgi:hypothetical protein